MTRSGLYPPPDRKIERLYRHPSLSHPNEKKKPSWYFGTEQKPSRLWMHEKGETQDGRTWSLHSEAEEKKKHFHHVPDQSIQRLELYFSQSKEKISIISCDFILHNKQTNKKIIPHVCNRKDVNAYKEKKQVLSQPSAVETVKSERVLALI